MNILIRGLFVVVLLCSSLLPAFAQSLSGNNSWSGDNYFGSGRPWCDVAEQGATGGNVSVDLPAFWACYNKLASLGGGTIYVPPPTSGNPYCIGSTGTGSPNGALVFTAPYILVLGAGAGMPVAACGVDGILFTLEGTSDALRWLNVWGDDSPNDYGVPSGTITAPSNNVIHLASASGSLNCDDCALEHVTVQGGYVGIYNQGAEVKMHDVHLLFSYGNALLESTPGTYSGGSISGWAIFADNNWPPACGGPLSSQTSISAWAASTNYTACTTVSEGSYWYQAVSSCTSGSTTPTLHAYRQTFTDGAGGCTWQLVSNTSLIEYYNHGAKENYLINLDTTGAALNSIVLDNSAEFFRCEMCIASESIGSSVNLTSGSYAMFDMPEIGAQLNLSANGIVTQSSWSGPLTVQNGYVDGNSWAANLTTGYWTIINAVKIAGGASGAVSIGTSKVTISNNQLSNPGGGSVAIVGNNETYVNVTNNTCGGSFTTCANGGAGSGSVFNGNPN